MGLKWVNSILKPDARSEKRHAFAGIVAYYWDGATPRLFPVRNISLGGVYVLTEERWYPDTIVKMILQCYPLHAAAGSRLGSNASKSICVLAQVVRTGPDGVGLRFVFAGTNGAAWKRTYPECATDRRAIRTFLDQFVQMQLGLDGTNGVPDTKTVKET